MAAALYNVYGRVWTMDQVCDVCVDSPYVSAYRAEGMKLRSNGLPEVADELGTEIGAPRSRAEN